MKKYYIGYVVAMLLLSTRLLAQTPPDRNVFWLHGLGEKGSDWDLYRTLFSTERRMTTYSQSYDDGKGLTEAVRGVRMNNVKIPNPIPAPATPIVPLPTALCEDPNNIAIGHSLGGIVAREAVRTYDPSLLEHIYFGGIITVGSPNNGLPFLNRMQTGDVDAAMDYGCVQMSRGPVSGLINNFTKTPVSALLLNVTVGSLSWTNEDMCGAIRKLFLSPVYGATSMQGYSTKPTPTDLAVGSIVLQQINNSSITVPRIAIWGNEQSPVHWRTVSSAATGLDGNIPQMANNFRAVYNGFHIAQFSLGVAFGLTAMISWPNPPFGLIAALSSANAFYCAAQWKKGRDWLDQSEGIWTDLIGAQRWEQQQKQVFALTSQAQAQIAAIEERLAEAVENSMDNASRGRREIAVLRGAIASIRNNPNNYVANGWITVNVYINEPSDGLVHRTSQIGINPERIYEARGVNHIQEMDARSESSVPGNNGEDPMERTFRLIWDLPIGSTVFHTPNR